MEVELTLDAFREARLSNTIHVACGGEEALDYLSGRGQYADRGAYPMPQLILLDLKLPRIDGSSVLRKIKGTPGLKRIPVIVLTSSQQEADRALCYELGANSYLVKPVSFEAFLDVIRRIGDYWLRLNVGPPQETSHGQDKT